ncbi:hypothetical protein SAMN05216454_1301 [Peptostreptococcus russellii]|uniref:Uncharacterized protein n=1 Tax=Peptostreptococcus russellii TaxID=215200 RepID=A0A1H8KFK7_9FIRM|nr:hypothetical protein [Peptostreptococcus russellii]SEN91763.1 hypothetical protein SAMN05216454_1301 [Peptostreptococcus russellii]
MARIRIKNTGVEFDITAIGTETARISYNESVNCNIPAYYIQNKDITPGCYQGNNYISKDELDYWLDNGEAEIVNNNFDPI